MLDPEVFLRADRATVEMGASALVRGANADTFKGRALATQMALIDGVPGAVFAPGGKPRVVFDFTIERDRISAINLIANPESLLRVDVQFLKD